MSADNFSVQIYDRVKSARAQRKLSQQELAKRLHVSQPRISELETKLRTGNVSDQVRLIAGVAEQLGMSLMLVPNELVPSVNSIIQDYEIEQRVGPKSIFDQIFDPAEEWEMSQPQPRTSPT